MSATTESTAVFLPSEGFVKLPIIQAVFPVSTSEWYRGIADGRFPKPVKLGKRAVAWRVSDIRTLIERVERGETQA